MDLKIEGRLIQKLALQTGNGKNGEWRKQEFVIETDDAFPKKICANLWSDRISQLDPIAINEKIAVYFNLESREFNGKWYTDVRAWRIEKAAQSVPVSDAAQQQPYSTQQQPAPAPQPAAPQYGNEDPSFGASDNDGLPF
ncbi:MAG TPA: DUF3127 domain-containing protein [Bacteroidales bacterium]|nr:DUF3127 domain-containing protein [Bacteroidales bacterium]